MNTLIYLFFLSISLFPFFHFFPLYILSILLNPLLSPYFPLHTSLPSSFSDLIRNLPSPFSLLSVSCTCCLLLKSIYAFILSPLYLFLLPISLAPFSFLFSLYIYISLSLALFLSSFSLSITGINLTKKKLACLSPQRSRLDAK